MSDEGPAEFGATERVSLSRVQQIAGAHLARSWSQVPHVTHHDEVDVTALEQLRRQVAERHSTRKITLLGFLVRFLAECLRAFPRFNSSLNDAADQLILKRYFNIGIAVDSPKGLLVAVIRDADQKDIPAIAVEIDELAVQARSKGLTMRQMRGGCMTISSLGRNGSVSFTPIINSPEVAILGVGGLRTRPFPAGNGGIDWRSVLPLSLSYDHRVINGAQACAFLEHLKSLILAPA